MASRWGGGGTRNIYLYGTPKNGGLGAGTAQKGDLSCGHSPKKGGGGLKCGHKQKTGFLGVATTRKRGNLELVL